MHHYYSNPLSIFTADDNFKLIPKLTTHHFELIRALPSFKRYIEDIVDEQPNFAKDLLTDNKVLAGRLTVMLRDVKCHQLGFQITMRCLEHLQRAVNKSGASIRPLRVLHMEVATDRLVESKYLAGLFSTSRQVEGG